MPPKFTREFQLTLLRYYPRSFVRCLRDYHTLRSNVPEKLNFEQVGPLGKPTTPHLPSVSGGIQFELYRVHSPLLTASLRFLFLPLLRCFNSGRSRSVLINTQNVLGRPIRKSWVHRLHAPTPGLSQLGTSLISS